MFTFGGIFYWLGGGRYLHIIMFINWLLPVKVHADDLMDQTARYKNSESLSYLKKQQKIICSTFCPNSPWASVIVNCLINTYIMNLSPCLICIKQCFFQGGKGDSPKCIDRSKLCDGKPDCTDGAEEKEACCEYYL